MVVLDKSEFKTGLVPIRAIVNFREKPSGVAMLLRRYDLDCGNGGLFHLHCATALSTVRTGRLLPEAAARRHNESSLLGGTSWREAPRPCRGARQSNFASTARPDVFLFLRIYMIRFAPACLGRHDLRL